MGMSSKLASKPTPADFTERLNPLLGPGEDLMAHCQVIPSARAHGGAGSIAASFSREGDVLVLSVSNVYLSFWDFGMLGDEQPSLTSQLPRQYVESFTDTGERAQGGLPVARMAFTDGSFVDWLLMSEPGPEFFVAAGL